MLRRALFAFALVALALPLLGMGGRGVEGFTSIPVPEKNYSAKVTDKNGVSVEVSMFSWEGQVYLGGYRGKGAFTVAFDRISRFEVGSADEDGKVPVRVYLRGGGTFEMKMDAKTYFYGKTSIGNYRIPVSGVKLVELR